MSMNDDRNIDEQARSYSSEAIKTFAEVMRDPLAENRDRLRAAENLVDRGHGKAVTPIAVKTQGKIRDQLASLTDDELYAIVHAEPLPSLVGPDRVIEADFDEVDPLLR
jgi:hypothetical protein